MTALPDLLAGLKALGERLRQAAPMVKPTAVRGMLPAWIGEVCLQTADALPEIIQAVTDMAVERDRLVNQLSEDQSRLRAAESEVSRLRGKVEEAVKAFHNIGGATDLTNAKNYARGRAAWLLASLNPEKETTK